MQYAGTNYRKFALGCRGPVIWNATPTAIQTLKHYAYLFHLGRFL